MPRGLKRDLDKISEKLTAGEYSAASQEATEASKSIMDGINRLGQGDSMGGAGALLEGLGQLTNLAAFLGPAGAAAGGILSLLTGIVSSILEMLNPEKKSLEERIEEIIKDEDLRKKKAHLSADEDAWIATGEILVDRLANTRGAFSEAQDAGKPFVFDTELMFIPNDITGLDMQPLPEGLSEEEKQLIKEGHLAKLGPTVQQRVTERQLQHLRAGLSWEYIKTNTNYEAHVKEINEVLDFLDEMKPPYSEEWGALLDQALGYVYRMWVSLHGILGLVDQNGHGMFVAMRDEIGRQFKDRLTRLSFRSVDACQIYHRWKSPDNIGPWESLYRRVGVTGENLPYGDAVGGGTYVASFAVSSYGTVFSATKDLTPRVGREGTGWVAAKGPMECEQIFIGEVAYLPQKVLVACVHGDGRKLSINVFDEAPGVNEPDKQKWTPNEGRWGEWQTRWNNLPFKIAAVAFFQAEGDNYGIYALGLNADFSVTLYQLIWDEGATPVQGFHWSKDEVIKAKTPRLYIPGRGDDMYGHNPEHWSTLTPYSCAISITSLLAVQVGNSVKFKDGGTFGEWDLAGQHFFWDNKLQTSQGRFYSDGTFVMCSNQGIRMRYWDVETGEPVWAKNPKIETEMIWKMPLSNASLMQKLLLSLQQSAED